jgi:hypothetical protein
VQHSLHWQSVSSWRQSSIINTGTQSWVIHDQ